MEIKNLLLCCLMVLALLHMGEARKSKAKKCIGGYTCQKTTSGSKRCVCIGLDKFCDRMPDCPMGEDELNCSCDPLSRPANGKVDLTEGLKAGNIAKYKCNNGYTLNGNPMRMCMENTMWSGTAPTCVPKIGCDCDNNRTIGDVRVPLNSSTDLLTLDQYNSIVVDMDYQGVIEFADASQEGIRNHFGLKIRISDGGPGNPDSRALTFDPVAFQGCVNLTTTTMEPIANTNLAINYMNIAGNTSDRRLNVHFSSCPDLYVWEMQCIGKTAEETLAAKSCPVEDTVIWIKVKDTDTGLDELPLTQIERDLFVNTGLQFCQIADLESTFIEGDYLCSMPQPAQEPSPPM